MNIERNITTTILSLAHTPTVQNAEGAVSLLFSPSRLRHVDNGPTQLASNNIVSHQAAESTFIKTTPLKKLNHFLTPSPLQISFKKEIDAALADYNAKSTKFPARVDYEKTNTIRISLQSKSGISSFIQREIPMYPYTGTASSTRDKLLAHIDRFLNVFRE